MDDRIDYDSFYDINGNILLCQFELGAIGHTDYVDNQYMDM